MARKRLLECSFLIPLRLDRNLSDGKLHARRVWIWLDEQLYALGGATQASQLYAGRYPDPDTGERVQDQSRNYFVAVTRAEVDHLRSILRRACQEFQQKCIYLSMAGRVEFIEGGSDVEG